MEAQLDNTQTKVFGKILGTLAKMGEYLCVQFSEDGLKLSTVNKSRSAFACCFLNADFFGKFKVKRGFNENVQSSPRAVKRLRGSILSDQTFRRCASPMFDTSLSDSNDELADESFVPEYESRMSLSMQKSQAAVSEMDAEEPSRDDLTGSRILFGPLVTIFKSKRQMENVERCTLKMDMDQMSRDRLVVQLKCDDGVSRTHRLYIELHEPLAAVYDKEASPDKWTASSRLFGDWLHHFHSKLHEVTMFSNGQKLFFRSYSEMRMEPFIVDENHIATQGLPDIRRSLQTELKVAPEDLDTFKITSKFAGLTFPLRELRALLALAESQDLAVSSFFNSQASGHPVIFSTNFSRQAVVFDVVLATILGDNS